MHLSAWPCSFDEFEKFYEEKAEEAKKFAETAGEGHINHMALVTAPPSLPASLPPSLPPCLPASLPPSRAITEISVIGEGVAFVSA